MQTRAVDSGRILVNDRQVGSDYTVREADVVKHTIHRHELAVAAQPIELLAVSDSVIAVNKPASVPVHPCGRYRHNTLTFMLARDHGIAALYRTSIVRRQARVLSSCLVLRSATCVAWVQRRIDWIA